MAIQEYVIDPSEIPWRQSATEGITFRSQVLLSGGDGGPEAFRFKFDPTPKVYAHMHLTSQFQLLLGGTMELPKMKTRPVGLHYTDHNRPYGPFSVGEGHEVLVLHPKQGGLISMASLEARRQIYLGGRELGAMEKDLEWLTVPGFVGVHVKVYIPRIMGPEALMIDYPPGMEVWLRAPLYGRYEVVIKGSVRVRDRELTTPGFRYVMGAEPAEPLLTGPAGATLMLLSFDDDALQGGLEQGIGMEAAEAIAEAI